MILEIASIWYPDYELQHWQEYLIYVALIWLAVGLNVFASQWIPMFNQFIFGLSVITLSATTITLFVCARNHHASVEWIFTDTTNRTGWSSGGFAFVLAVGNAVFSYLGSDCGAHVRIAKQQSNDLRPIHVLIFLPVPLAVRRDSESWQERPSSDFVSIGDRVPHCIPICHLPNVLHHRLEGRLKHNNRSSSHRDIFSRHGISAGRFHFASSFRLLFLWMPGCER
jgi:ABC-type multidrug transport system fused ATPase/permease subunit